MGANTTGWASNGTLTRATDVVAMPVTTGARWISNGFVQTPTGVVSPGDVVTASWYFGNFSGFTADNKTVYVAFTRSVGGDDFSQTATVSFGANGNTSRVSVTKTAPANATGIYLVIDSINGNGGGGGHMDISGVMYEIAPAIDTFFYPGITAGAVWDGTPENSTSTLNDGLVGVVSDFDARWLVYNSIPPSDLDARWQVYNRITSDLDVRWTVQSLTTTPTVNQTYLTWQRKMTMAFIADDPTTAALIPTTRTTTASGGFTDTPTTPRDPQTFKLSELAYDQRPTITVAGVERIIDYHLIGPWDMAIEVGDYWFDDEGTRYDVVGFSDGWSYMTKAYVLRHIPREANP
jgi:hypothetical protein